MWEDMDACPQPERIPTHWMEIQRGSCLLKMPWRMLRTRSGADDVSIGRLWPALWFAVEWGGSVGMQFFPNKIFSFSEALHNDTQFVGDPRGGGWCHSVIFRVLDQWNCDSWGQCQDVDPLVVITSFQFGTNSCKWSFPRILKFWFHCQHHIFLKNVWNLNLQVWTCYELMSC